MNGSIITAIPHDCSSPGPGAEFQSVPTWQYVSMSTQSCIQIVYIVYCIYFLYIKPGKILILERKIPELAQSQGLVAELPGIPYGWKEASTTNIC